MFVENSSPKLFFFFLTRAVSFLRFLRIIILVRVFRLASQKKELEKVTRRMVTSSHLRRNQRIDEWNEKDV